MLAERTCIDTTRPNADESFREAFSSLISDRQEGAVLKADGALYNERRWPWVKASNSAGWCRSLHGADIWLLAQAGLYPQLRRHRRLGPSWCILGEGSGQGAAGYV